MSAVRPFFLLVGRASVFWLGAFALIVGSMIVAGATDRDSPLDRILDATFIATIWFPAAAGWLAGLMIQELQHTSFAHLLPGIRSRIATGYVVTGLVVAGLVAGAIATTGSSSWSLPLLYVVAVGAYCAGGAIQDPLSSWLTFTNSMLVILAIGLSASLAPIAGRHPWITAVVSATAGAAAVLRLFARATFRRKPFRLSKPVPGSFSLQKSQSYELRRTLEAGPKKSGWRADYVGGRPWAWVRAALHETHGAMGWKSLARAISRMWGVGALVLIYAWADKGEMHFAEAAGRSFYDAVFRSPHQDPFGEKGGPFGLVLIVVAAAGVVTALFNSVTLHDAIAYPLSRLQRARVAFRAGLIDLGLLLLVLGIGLYLAGQLTGWLIGFEARFDFIPFHFRVLMVTLVLLPFGHWGRLKLGAATRRKASNMLVAVSFGVVGFVVVAGLIVFLLPRMLTSPIVELFALVGALVISQWIYRDQLRSYYRTADLA